MTQITPTRAEQIIELHGVVVSSAKMTIDAGIEAGRLLSEQKQDLPHGQFGKWIKDNLPFTDRTARNYMTLWSRRELLKTETVSDFTGAYKLLRTGFDKAEDADKDHKKSEARIREALKNKAIRERAEPIEAELLPTDPSVTPEPDRAVAIPDDDVVDDVDDDKFGTAENFWEVFNSEFAETPCGRNGQSIQSYFVHSLATTEDGIWELLDMIEGAEEEGFHRDAAKAREKLRERLAKLTILIDRVKGACDE